MTTFGGASVFHIAGTVISIFNFVFIIIAMASDYWMMQKLEFPGTTIKMRLGLWRMCTETNSVEDCDSTLDHEIFKDEAWFKATQAFVVLATICFLVVMVCALIKWFCMQDVSILVYLACALSLVGAICAMIGWAVYLGKIEDSSPNLSEAKENIHFSFGFCVVATITGIIAFVCFLLDVMKGGSVGQSSD